MEGFGSIVHGNRLPCSSVSERMGVAIEFLDPDPVRRAAEIYAERGLRREQVAGAGQSFRSKTFNLGLADILTSRFELDHRTDVSQKFFRPERPWFPGKKNRLVGRAIGTEQVKMADHGIEHSDTSAGTPVP